MSTSMTIAWDTGFDIPALIRRQPEGTHVYSCGPAGLMDAVVNAAEALGWPAESIHVERFGAGPTKGDAPFVAVCQHSRKRSTSERPSTCWIVSSMPASRFRSGVALGDAGPAKLGSWLGRSSIAIGFSRYRAGGGQVYAGLRLARTGQFDPGPLMSKAGRTVQVACCGRGLRRSP